MERILQGLQAIEHEQAALRLDEPGEARGRVVWALGVGIAEVPQRALEEGADAGGPGVRGLVAPGSLVVEGPVEVGLGDFRFWISDFRFGGGVHHCWIELPFVLPAMLREPAPHPIRQQRRFPDTAPSNDGEEVRGSLFLGPGVVEQGEFLVAPEEVGGGVAGDEAGGGDALLRRRTLRPDGLELPGGLLPLRMFPQEEPDDLVEGVLQVAAVLCGDGLGTAADGFAEPSEVAGLQGSVLGRGSEGRLARRMAIAGRTLRLEGHETLLQEPREDGLPLGVGELIEEGTVKAVLPFPEAEKVFPALLAAPEEVLDSLGIRHRPGGGPDEVDDDIAGEDELVEFLDEVGVVILEFLLEDGLYGDAVEARGQLGAIARELGRDRGEEDPVGVERGHGRWIPEEAARAKLGEAIRD